MIVPPWNPGVFTPTSGFIVNGIGYLRVDPETAKGWDFSSGSRLFDEDSKSGWNGWIGLAVGIAGMLTGTFLVGGVIGVAITGGSAIYAGYSAKEIAQKGMWGTYHWANGYNKLKESLNSSGMFARAARVDFVNWLKVNWGQEFDGARTVLARVKNLEDFAHAGWNNKSILTPEEKERLIEMNKQE